MDFAWGFDGILVVLIVNYLGFGSSSPHFWEFGGVCMGFSWGWIESQLNLIPTMVDGIDPFLGIGWAFGGLIMGLWWVVNGVNCELLGVWFPINPFVGIVGVCVFHEVWWGWIENQLILIPTIVEGTDPFVEWCWIARDLIGLFHDFYQCFLGWSRAWVGTNLVSSGFPLGNMRG